jgi:epsilon-lactone hydrolase
MNPANPIGTQRRRLELAGTRPDWLLQKMYPGLSYETRTLGKRNCLVVRNPQAGDRNLLYFHGGAFCLGSLKSYQDPAMLLAQELRVNLYLVDYRLAPDHPYPAALDDALAAWNELRAESKELPFLMGDSGGGGLTLALLHRIEPLSLRVICFSPWTDWSCSQKTFETNAGRDIFLSKESLSGYARHFLGTTDPRKVSPLHQSTALQSEVLLFAGTDEVLLDDSRQFYAKFLATHSSSQLVVVDRMQHVFPLFFPFLKESKRALKLSAEFLKA